MKDARHTNERVYEKIIIIESLYHLWVTLEILSIFANKKNVLLLISDGIKGFDFNSITLYCDVKFIKTNKYLSKRGLNSKLDFGDQVTALIFKNNLFSANKYVLFNCSFVAKQMLNYLFQQGHTDLSKLCFYDLGPPLAGEDDDLYSNDTYDYHLSKLSKIGFKQTKIKEKIVSIENTTGRRKENYLAKKSIKFVILDQMGLQFINHFFSDKFLKNQSFFDSFDNITIHISPEVCEEKTLKNEVKKYINKPSTNTPAYNDSIFVVLANWTETVQAYKKILHSMSSKIVTLDMSKSIFFESVQMDDSFVIPFNGEELIKTVAKIKTKNFEYQENFLPIEQYALTINRSTKQKLKNVGAATQQKRTFGIALLHFRRPKLLLEALNSVLNQTILPDEIKIFDDGSEDERVNLVFEQIKSKHKEVEIFIQPNKYLGALRNFAIQNMKSEYIFFLDDDNILRPDALEMIKMVCSNTNASIIGSYSVPFTDGEKPNFSNTTKIKFGGVAGFSTMARNWICDGNCLVERKHFIKVGGNSELYGVGSDDHEFFQKSFFSKSEIEIIAEPLYAARQMEVRLRDKHLTSSKSIKAMRVANSFYFLKGNNSLKPIYWYHILTSSSNYKRSNSSRKKIIVAILTLCLVFVYLSIPRRFLPQKIKDWLEKNFYFN